MQLFYTAEPAVVMDHILAFVRREVHIHTGMIAEKIVRAVLGSKSVSLRSPARAVAIIRPQVAGLTLDSIRSISHR